MNDFYEKLDEAYGSGDLAAAEALLLSAIEETREGSIERAGLFNELAGFYKGVSRYAESESAFTQALDLFDSAGMSATLEYATVLLNLAGLYRIKGETDRSAELFLRAMNKLEDAGEQDSYAYVSILNNLALTYQEKGEYALAFDYASTALARLRANEGNEHEIAVSLNNLAAIKLGQNDQVSADVYVSEALEMYDAMTETNVHHAAALTTKAVLQCRAGNYNSALEGFRRALELTKLFFGENIEFAICKRNISDVCGLLGDHDAAVSEQAEAVSIMERILGREHPSVRSALARLEQLKEKC